ncbi:MAG: hypothetical protein IK027_05455, partial [Deltaproteobacteria bacterium]|nr:hypothetical protein [Deltaproteobacteria bacterium]
MKRFRKPLRFVLCLLPVALLGGWCMAQMTFSTMDGALLEEAVRQLGSREALSAFLVGQTLLYAVVCGFFGYLLAEKEGLMRPFRFRRAETLRVLALSAALGAVLLIIVMFLIHAMKSAQKAKRLIEATEKDYLTGLYNRQYFFQYAYRAYRERPDAKTDAIVLNV